MVQYELAGPSSLTEKSYIDRLSSRACASHSPLLRKAKLMPCCYRGPNDVSYVSKVPPILREPGFTAVKKHVLNDSSSLWPEESSSLMADRSSKPVTVTSFEELTRSLNRSGNLSTGYPPDSADFYSSNSKIAALDASLSRKGRHKQASHRRTANTLTA